MSWAVHADKVLATLFKFGQPAPTKKELRDAYPFGERAMYPYKMWCKRVKAWKAAHAKGLSTPATSGDYFAAHRARHPDTRGDGDTGELGV